MGVLSRGREGLCPQCAGQDARHRVPPPGLLSAAESQRPRPDLHGDRQIADLIVAARKLCGRSGLCPLTCATLLALLAVSGMPPSKPLRRDRDDVDLAGGVPTVPKSEFGKYVDQIVMLSRATASEFG